jgi:RHS repeat-associated protein
LSGNIPQECKAFPYGDMTTCKSGGTNPTGPGLFTGKDRDSQSDLDYFGARYYNSTMGRFMSPDPSSLSVVPTNPQTWNRYAYVYNDPLSFQDENGKWPTQVHNQIIDKAFPGLTAEQRQILKDVSASQDGLMNGGQSHALSFEHAMRAPGQTVEEAETQFDNFISAQTVNAYDLQLYLSDIGAAGDSLKPEALVAFGKALHAIVDSTSPAHEGFQVWHYWDAVGHHFREQSPTPQQMRDAIAAARTAFFFTFGAFGFQPVDNSSVRVIQGEGTYACGGSTEIPCPN